MKKAQLQEGCTYFPAIGSGSPRRIKQINGGRVHYVDVRTNTARSCRAPRFLAWADPEPKMTIEQFLGWAWENGWDATVNQSRADNSCTVVVQGDGCGEGLVANRVPKYELPVHLARYVWDHERGRA